MSQPVKLDLNKKFFPNQKTIQNFTIDSPRVQKNKKWKSSHAGNKSYQLTSAGQSALGWQVGRHRLAGNSYILHVRIFIACFSEPFGINIQILAGLLLW